MTTTAPSGVAAPVLEALRSVSDENSMWVLADTLHAAIPTGTGGFDAIMSAAANEGIHTKLRAATLRLYRDIAVAWPKSKRVAGMSFSAHRETMPLVKSNGVESAVDLLNALAKSNKVSIAHVRTAVRVKQGRTPTANVAQRTGAAPPPAVGEVLADLKAGAPKLIKSIGVDTGGDDLDKLHRGLGKVTAHVDTLRARKARASAAAAKRAATPATNGNGKTAAKPAAAKGGRRGDLRGL